MNEESVAVRQFDTLYRETKRRIATLEGICVEAGINGGIITISLECLQDQIIAYKTSPEVLMPYIHGELNEKKKLLLDLEKKMSSVLEIITKGESNE